MLISFILETNLKRSFLKAFAYSFPCPLFPSIPYPPPLSRELSQPFSSVEEGLCWIVRCGGGGGGQSSDMRGFNWLLARPPEDRAFMLFPRLLITALLPLSGKSYRVLLPFDTTFLIETGSSRGSVWSTRAIVAALHGHEA
ncbi:unnamed protein product [Haemonchus placei]|uniref:Uncharacterized protein n=1 Tax=Haemonchus placei TaxID=6290 RepID=A0A0N4WPW3_HAEPC|nr:unnamed protein product [Haemonchus placei]